MIAWWITWLAQGFALALAAGVPLRLFPRMSAGTQCALWCTVLCGLGILAITGVTNGVVSPAIVPAGLPPVLLIPSPPRPFMPILIGVWVGVSLLLLLRVAAGVCAINIIKKGCRALSPEIEAQLPMWLRVRSGARHVRLVVSDAVPGATLLGFLRPSIVLPRALIEALSPNEIDQVVLHEYAHVRRWDDWGRLLQTALCSVMWIHPAAFVASRRLDREREAACDAWVVQHTGEAKSYARCLIHAAEAQRSSVPPGFVRAVVGLPGPALFGPEGDLSRRVERLLATERRAPSVKTSYVGAMVGCVLLALVTQLPVGRIVAEVGEVEWLPAPAVARVGYGGPPPSAQKTARSMAQSGRAAFDGVADPPIDATPIAAAPGLPDTAGASEIAESPEEPPDNPPILSARRYDVVYTVAAASDGTGRPETGWGSAGIAIGNAGRRTGMGIKTVFSRAGASVARRF